MDNFHCKTIRNAANITANWEKPQQNFSQVRKKFINNWLINAEVVFLLLIMLIKVVN